LDLWPKKCNTGNPVGWQLLSALGSFNGGGNNQPA
jgi:hypothetical protein